MVETGSPPRDLKKRHRSTSRERYDFRLRNNV